MCLCFELLLLTPILCLTVLCVHVHRFQTDSFRTCLDILFDADHQWSYSTTISLVGILNRCVAEGGMSPLHYLESPIIYTEDIMVCMYVHFDSYSFRVLL